MKIAFLLTKCLSLALYFGVLLLFLCQLLPLASKKKSETEAWILRLCEPILFCADCLCRMLSVNAELGIDHRYPVAIGTLSLAAMAVTVSLS